MAIDEKAVATEKKLERLFQPPHQMETPQLHRALTDHADALYGEAELLIAAARRIARLHNRCLGLEAELEARHGPVPLLAEVNISDVRAR